MPPTAPGSLISGAANYLTVAQALAQPSMVAISGTAVDWAASAGGLYQKTLAGNTTFTFTNVVTGESIRIFLSRGAASGHTITWPAGITWTGGTAAPTDTPGYTEILLTCTGTNTYAGSHATRANTAATSSVPGPPAPASELVDGGTPASPGAPENLVAVELATPRGEGLRLNGDFYPRVADMNGFPAYDAGTGFDVFYQGGHWNATTSVDGPQVWVADAGTEATPDLVPAENWTVSLGSDPEPPDIQLALASLVGNDGPATPSAPGSLV